MALGKCFQFRHICKVNIIRRASQSSSVVSSKTQKVKYEETNEKPNRLLEYDVQHLSTRGYLRNAKPYTPPPNVDKIITDIVKEHSLSSFADDISSKFSLLQKCSLALGHSVPNSLLHKIDSVEKLIVFYQSPVNTTTPLEKMKGLDLPKNLHILYNYVRFHPENDTKFGGVSAFPESSTIMSNPKYKKKYAGYDAKTKIRQIY